MNSHAQHLAKTLHAVLRQLPGAAAVSLHAFDAWTLLIIVTSSDEAVSQLGEALGLGGPSIQHTRDTWFYCARAERAALRVEVAGPHHSGPPPQTPAQ